MAHTARQDNREAYGSGEAHLPSPHGHTNRGNDRIAGKTGLNEVRLR